MIQRCIRLGITTVDINTLRPKIMASISGKYVLDAFYEYNVLLMHSLKYVSEVSIYDELAWIPLVVLPRTYKKPSPAIMMTELYFIISILFILRRPPRYSGNNNGIRHKSMLVSKCFRLPTVFCKQLFDRTRCCANIHEYCVWQFLNKYPLLLTPCLKMIKIVVVYKT